MDRGVAALEWVQRGARVGPLRPLQTLTFEAFRDMLATTFAGIADQRDPRRITWEMPAVLMSAFDNWEALLRYHLRETAPGS